MNANTSPQRDQTIIGSDTATIERNNDATRARLSGNLDTIQARLTPSQMLDQAIAYLRTNEGAQFTSNLGASVRENPMPAAVTGIGLAWLMATNARRGSSKSHALQSVHMHTRAHEAGMAVTRLPDEPEHQHRARIDDARGTALGVTRRPNEPSESYSSRINDVMATAKHWASQAQTQVQDSVGSMTGTMGNQMSTMRDQASSRASGMMDQARQGAGGIASTVTGNPMLLGALSVTAGALLGALLPHVAVEDEWLGETGQTVNRLAHSTAEDVMRKGEQAIEATMDAAKTSAQEQGLTPDEAAHAGADIATKARTVAEAALHAGSDAIRK